MDECRFVPLDQLVDPPVVLRLVNRDFVAYMELRDSLADRGFSIPSSWAVHPVSRQVRRGGRAVPRDGRPGSRLPGRRPSSRNLTDDDLLAIQIQANALRPETTPMEYARQINGLWRPARGHPGGDQPSHCPQEPRLGGETLGCWNCERIFNWRWIAAKCRWGPPTNWPGYRTSIKPSSSIWPGLLPVAAFCAAAQAFLEAVSRGRPARKAGCDLYGTSNRFCTCGR